MEDVEHFCISLVGVCKILNVFKTFENLFHIKYFLSQSNKVLTNGNSYSISSNNFSQRFTIIV